MKISLALKVLLLTAALITPAAQADVRSVPGQFATIQAAIDACSDFDVVLIAPGNYGEAVLIVDRAVSLIADGGQVTLAYLVVRDLAPFREVVLRGLHIALGPSGFPAVHIRDSLGAVRIEQCDFTGGSGGQPINTTGKPGLWVEACASVNVSASTLTGGHGADLVEEDTDSPPGPGGPALFVRGSLLSISDSMLTGGHGGDIYDTVTYTGGYGGDGLHNIASRVMVGGCTLTGGDGGMADCTFQFCGQGGDGGDGLHQEQPTASTWLRDEQLSGGAPGPNGDGQGTGWPGSQQWIEAGTVTTLTESWRSMSASSPAREGQFSTLNISGVPGDQVFLWASIDSSHLPLIGKQGVFLLGLPALLSHIPLGVLPVGGAFAAPLLIPELGPGIEAISVHLQLVVIGGSSALLGSLSTVTLVDQAF